MSSAYLHRYKGAPMPVDFDQLAAMKAKQIVPSLGLDRQDLTHAVIGQTFDYGAGVLGWFNNIFAARHNAGLMRGKVVKVYYDEDDSAQLALADRAAVNQCIGL
jgi:hypothetical protein